MDTVGAWGLRRSKDVGVHQLHAYSRVEIMWEKNIREKIHMKNKIFSVVETTGSKWCIWRCYKQNLFLSWRELLAMSHQAGHPAWPLLHGVPTRAGVPRLAARLLPLVASSDWLG